MSGSAKYAALGSFLPICNRYLLNSVDMSCMSQMTIRAAGKFAVSEIQEPVLKV